MALMENIGKHKVKVFLLNVQVGMGCQIDIYGLRGIVKNTYFDETEAALLDFLNKNSQ